MKDVLDWWQSKAGRWHVFVPGTESAPASCPQGTRLIANHPNDGVGTSQMVRRDGKVCQWCRRLAQEYLGKVGGLVP